MEVKPPPRDPAPRGQALKHRRAPLRVAAGDELTFGLVVDEDAARRFQSEADRSPIDCNFVARQRAIAELGYAPADRDAAGFDPGLDGATRAYTGGREQLLQPLGPLVSLPYRWLLPG